MTAESAPLTAAQAEHFRLEGWLLLPGLVPPETCQAILGASQAQLAAAVPPLEYEAELGYAGAPASLDAPGGRTVRRLRSVWQRGAPFSTQASAPAVLSRLRQLLGSDIRLVLAHHNCVMTKHPGYGTATGWHRDIRYWSFQRNELVSVWLALGNEREHNGALKVIPGSHRETVRPHQLDELDFLRPEVEDNQALFARGHVVDMNPGDVLFFHSGLFHAAGRNDSDAVKHSLVFAYRAAHNLALPGSRSEQGGDVGL